MKKTKSQIGLEPAIPQLTVTPYILKGKNALATLKEINNVIDSKYNGNDNLKVLRSGEINEVPTTFGSNPLILPVVNQIIAPEFRIIKPEELERTLQEGDPIRIQGNHYVDMGLVLDFSGNNHELAVQTFEGLPKELRDFDRLPAVMIGYGLRNTKFGDYGVMPKFQRGTELRTAKILAEPTNNFDENDSELIRTGLPSKLGSGKRRLYNSTQNKPSEDNLGISRFDLNSGRDLYSDYNGLSDSNADGRVVCVRAEGAEYSPIHRQITGR
ncbi:hypothetical protein J4402_02055 [Candidatus Pacearchaeota archaeon]|nr:hypothetical protein [uncultured archaeon]AQS31845.1 hypothetical protein [uncultured archaeon]MBS3088541.1 hypothetical protein [Candidatus Pacearchaeota archaeon]